jgi:antitoxin component YwqK of YwqJK toxin-antitoxin module
MNRIFGPIFALVLLFPSLALGDPVEWDDLVITSGLYYKKFTDVPFTGEVTGQEQGSFKDGKKEGPWVGYHDNGQLWWKGDYKDGKKDGPWVYYHENGQLESKGDWKDGKIDGPWVGYWDNGQLRWKGEYKDGEKVSSYTVDRDDLVVRDGLYYEESSDVPFTGEVVGYWDCLPSAPLGQIELIA